MWAPSRRTAPIVAGAGGGEPAMEEHVLADLQAARRPGRGRSRCAARPDAVELAADAGADQADRAVLAGAGGGEPVAEEHAWPTCRPSATRAGPESLRSVAPSQLSWPPIRALSQADRAVLAGAGGGEPAAEEHDWPTCRPSAARAGRVVAQGRPVAARGRRCGRRARRTAPTSPVPVAMNPPLRSMPGRPAGRRRARAGPSRCARSPWCIRGCPSMWAPRRRTAPYSAWPRSMPSEDEHSAGEPGPAQGWIGGVFKAASNQGDGSQVGINSKQASL